MSFTLGLMELVGVQEQVPGYQCDPAQTLRGNSNKRDLGKCVPVIPNLCQTSRRMGGELECVAGNSTLCLAAVWVQVCMHVFLQRTMNSFVFSSTQTHTHTPLTNSSARV